MGGGIATSLNLICQHTSKTKFQHVIINGVSKELSQIENHENITIHNLEFSRDINLIRDTLLFFKVLKLCKLENPDLIHGHSAKGGIVGKLVGFFTRTPCLHTPQAYSFLSTDNRLKRFFYLSIEKILKLLPHKILASSNSEAQRARYELKYPQNRILTFSNSIEPINILEGFNYNIKWPQEYICTVGRPSYQKNIEFMIDVLHSIKKEKPNIHLVIMGVGYYSPNLNSVKQKIHDLGLQENVTILDWISRQDIFSIVKSSQLYISTARYEGLPYAVIEALALKKALVLTNVDGNKDLVDTDKNGYLVDENDLHDFKNKVVELIKNTEKRKSFEINSYKKYLTSFDISKTISTLEEIYISESSQPEF